MSYFNLTNIWKDRKAPLPGTIDDFLEFVGAASQAELEDMNFESLEQLPGLKDNAITKNTLISEGGSYRIGRENYVWNWIIPEDGFFEAGEKFDGIGGTYNEAAIRGLVTYWELTTLRKQQGNPLRVDGKV